MQTPWFLIVHFGEASLMFPLAGIVALRLAYLGQWKQAFYWLLSLSVGAAVILIGKLAFEFGGWSMPAADVYSISGHAMLTASVYPVSLTVLGSIWSKRAARVGLFSGICLALLAAVALVGGRYHTLSETLIGMVVGFTVTWANLRPSHWLLAPSQMPRLGRKALCAVLLVILPVSIYPIRVQLWSSALSWLGVTERYSRHIGVDPVSGRTVVTVVQGRLIPYRKSFEYF